VSTIIFFTALFVLGVVVLSRVPGLEHFVKPVIGLLFSVLEAMLTNLWAWCIFVVKTLIFSHLDLIKHLLLSAEQIDPSHRLKEEYEKS
jgi:hypothetical protein